METAGNETLDRIQREIEEALQRENELRQKYNQLNNNEPEHTNGFKTPSPEPVQPPKSVNGHDPLKKMFVPNPSNKGVMHKFLKMRGKLNIVTMKSRNEPQNAWVPDVAFEPAKVTIGSGKPIRNGFVSAEEKMKRELQEFQRREDELRKERQKSQPDLMAALQKEEEEEKVKPRSLSLNGLKRAQSLAELCEGESEGVESPGTHSLIKRFENMSQS